MKISIQSNINFGHKIFQRKKELSRPLIFQTPNKDEFQKTSLVLNSKEDNLSLTTKDINEAYIQMVAKTLEISPVMNELDIKIPKLSIEDMDDAAAAYDFPSNTISINSDFKKDVYCHQVFDKMGNMIYGKITFDKEPPNVADTLGVDLNDIKTVKLNTDEKRLYLKSVLIHELRHWTQEHILASTKGCEGLFERKLNTVKKIIATYEEMIEFCKQNHLKQKMKQYKTKLAEVKKQYFYILNFKPKQILSEDYKISCSILPYEEKYWSVKEHFLPAGKRYKSTDDNEYSSSPFEIDAFYIQGEFLFDEEIKNRNSKIRQDVCTSMTLACLHHGMFAIENLEQYGYLPLIIN